MSKIGLIITFALSLVYCSRQKENRTYYSDGKLKEVSYLMDSRTDSLIKYGQNGSRISKSEFVQKDTVVTLYHQNGHIESKGSLTNDTLKIGWWNYYEESGSLRSKRHYVLKCDDYYLNQSIVFSAEMDTVYSDDDFNETVFFDYKLSKAQWGDTLFYTISPISYRSKLELVLMSNNDFCNEAQNVDTVIPLPSKKGSIFLDSSLNFRSGFVFDYYIDTLLIDGEERLNAVSRKIYFDTVDDL